MIVRYVGVRVDALEADIRRQAVLEVIGRLNVPANLLNLVAVFGREPAKGELGDDPPRIGLVAELQTVAYDLLHAVGFDLVMIERIADREGLGRLEAEAQRAFARLLSSSKGFVSSWAPFEMNTS